MALVMVLFSHSSRSSRLSRSAFRRSRPIDSSLFTLDDTPTNRYRPWSSSPTHHHHHHHHHHHWRSLNETRFFVDFDFRFPLPRFSISLTQVRTKWKPASSRVVSSCLAVLPPGCAYVCGREPTKIERDRGTQGKIPFLLRRKRAPSHKVHL